MAFLKRFVSQQLLFLFSKHLDTMLNVTDCGIGRTDLWLYWDFWVMKTIIYEYDHHGAYYHDGIYYKWYNNMYSFMCIDQIGPNKKSFYNYLKKYLLMSILCNLYLLT